jgi:hypothetical protein
VDCDHNFENFSQVELSGEAGIPRELRAVDRHLKQRDARDYVRKERDYSKSKHYDHHLVLLQHSSLVFGRKLFDVTNKLEESDCTISKEVA